MNRLCDDQDKRHQVCNLFGVMWCQVLGEASMSGADLLTTLSLFYNGSAGLLMDDVIWTCMLTPNFKAQDNCDSVCLIYHSCLQCRSNVSSLKVIHNLMNTDYFSVLICFSDRLESDDFHFDCFLR